MTGPRFVLAATVVLGALGLAACGGDSGADEEAFCAAYDRLGQNNPFSELTMASPDEMKAAFDQLAEAADEIADAAPSNASVQADAYASAIDALMDQLRAAGYDPRNVDATAYQQAVTEYQETGGSLGREAEAICP